MLCPLHSLDGVVWNPLLWNVSLALRLLICRLLSHPLLLQVTDSMVAISRLMIGPLAFKVAPLICPLHSGRVQILFVRTLRCGMVPPTRLTSYQPLWWSEDLVHSLHDHVNHGFSLISFVSTRQIGRAHV